MPALKAHQIESMLEDLDAVYLWLRDLGLRDATAEPITNPARTKVQAIKSKLLRASLGDVRVEAA